MITMTGLLLLAACSDDKSERLSLLPHWDAPVPSGNSVLDRADMPDPASQPYPNLASVPPRPTVSAADRITSLHRELAQDRAEAETLRASGAHASDTDGQGLASIAPANRIAPPPAPPHLVNAPRIDLNAPSFTTRRKPDAGSPFDQPLTLPDTNTGEPEPPPTIPEPAVHEPVVSEPAVPVIAPPPEPALADLAVPAPVAGPLPDFTVQPLTVASADPATPPEPPLLTLGCQAQGTSLDPAETAQLKQIVPPLLANGGRLRLVPYALAGKVAPDQVLTCARSISAQLIAEGLARARIVIAPPEPAGHAARAGQIAIFTMR